ncbi:MAG: VWA domain-containing protein [Spirochaetaceae bacterium]|nr:MAG: VWA domain-containing protein [Spirochaetaceae bacterium]
MWVFEAPAYLLLLLFLPVLFYFRHVWHGRGGKLALPVQLWKGISFHSGVVGLRFLYLSAAACFWAGAVLMIMALAGPTLVERERVYLSRGIDIMFVLDESPTMAAQDFAPETRFESARGVIRDFVQRRENDAIGLVSFAKEAALRMPPTVDHGALLAALDQVRIMELGDGTAIGNALAVAALHLETSKAPERVIVLLTDGINNAGEILPETAARVAAQKGIRIYTVAIGTEQEAVLEFEDPHTGRIFRGRFEGGFDEELLRTIADIANGSYFHAGSSGTLQAVLQSIDTIETVERRVRVEVQRYPFHREWLMLALGLLLLDFVLRKWLLREIL